MAIIDETDETTDPEHYLASNPDFAKCRKKHDLPHEDDVPLLEAYNDQEATHDKRFVCSRCGLKRRKRFQVVLRRGRVVSYVELKTRDTYPPGYVAKGTRISRSYVTERAIRAEVEQQAAVVRKAGKPRSSSAASVRVVRSRGPRRIAA